MTPSTADRALELIDELRKAWTTDTARAAEILGELQATLYGGLREQGWAIVRRERLQREHREREQRELKEREAGGDDG
jgi:hypothetical protein